MTEGRKSTGYQIILVFLLSLNFGIVFFDRNSLNSLITYVQPDLKLSPSQIGWISGIFSFTWALAAFGVSRVSDMLGNRKLLLVLSILFFSACSFLSGLASSFAFLLGARILMGVAEGGVMPISHAMVASDVEPKFRGLAQGIAQNLGSNFIGTFVAFNLLNWVAANYGWQKAFYFAGAPGILCAIMIWFLIKDDAAPTAAPSGQQKSLGDAFTSWLEAIREALKVRNVWVCVVMGILLVAFFMICMTFTSLYLTSERGYSKADANALMGVLGLSATVTSFLVAGLSDYIGRRPVMIGTPLIAVILPLAVLFFHGSYGAMEAIFFVGWVVVGIFPLFMATIPSESVSAAQAATVFGLSMGSCEILGGAAGPSIAGMAAEIFGPKAPFWIMVALALASAAFALFLKETAPRKTDSAQAAPLREAA